MEPAELTLFARGLRDATESSSGAALDADLLQLGWLDAFADHPQAAVSALFAAQGAANATSSALDWVLGSTLGIGPVAEAGVVMPALRDVAAPGTQAGPHWAVHGVALGCLATCRTAVVVSASTEPKAERDAVSVPVHALGLRRVHGLDPELGLLEATGALDVATSRVLGAGQWEDAVALGQLALGYEMLGAARTMIELARQHALDRVQFGRPVGTFQAVRHRLADSLVAAEAAGALLEASWEDPLRYGAAAKAFTGRQARLVGRHCQQVLAGIGFTTEHPFHRFVRRVLVLDQLLGAGTVLTRRLGTEILDAGAVPAAFPL
jgi:alkylation response protein AidB-like acyl-CoA dehydrogenase